jgi:glycosyltransferase involved in cell wall biosynthesis
VDGVRVLGFGTYDRRQHPRIGVLLDGLAALGCTVEEVNAPLDLSTADRVELLTRPWTLPRLLGRLLSRWSTLVAGRRALAHRPDVVLVGYLGQFDVLLARILFPRTPIALDLLVFGADTASDRRVRRGVRTRLLGGLDALAARCADVVVVDTAEHLELLPDTLRHKGLVVPVGAPDEWFTDAPVAVRRPLKVVFFGLFTPLQGAPTIARAVAALPPDPPVEVLMVGAGQDLAESRRLLGSWPGVRWVDWLEPAALRVAVSDSDVCLGVFGQGPKALRVVPNKVFQGAAAGCVIVTSDTAPQRRALGDAAVYVPAGDASALSDVLVDLARHPDRVVALRTAARARAETFTPAAVVRPLRERLAALVPPAPTTTEPHPMPSTTTALAPLSIRAWLRYDLITTVMREVRPATVLEVGCGQGALGSRLAAGLPDPSGYLGVEPDDASFSVARQRVTSAGGAVLHGVDADVPGDRTFDLVCAFEVLEHLEDDVAALTRWAARVRPGGTLLLSVPAWQHRFGPMDVGVGHYRRYAPEDLASKLRTAGLVAPSVWVYGWPLGFALEGVRNQIDGRRHAAPSPAGTSVADLTAASGRTFQPPNRGVGTVVQVATVPFRLLQRLRPGAGIGLIATARAPRP